MAHVNHTMTLKAGIKKIFDVLFYLNEQSNITPQTWLTNRNLGSDPPALILQKAEWARPAVDVTLRRLKLKTGYDITEEGINAIRYRKETLSRDQLQSVSTNGMSELERAGQSVEVRRRR